MQPEDHFPKYFVNQYFASDMSYRWLKNFPFMASSAYSKYFTFEAILIFTLGLLSLYYNIKTHKMSEILLDKKNCSQNVTVYVNVIIICIDTATILNKIC